MRKLLVVAVMSVLFIVIGISPVFAQWSKSLPVGAPALSSSSASDAGEFLVTKISNEAFEVKIPVSPSQYAEQKLPADTIWAISASFAYIDEATGKWVLIGSNNHVIGTGKAVDGYVAVQGKYPEVKAKNGIFWVRVYGQIDGTSNWLWINQSSKFNRYAESDGKADTKKPGYEFILSKTKKEYLSANNFAQKLGLRH